MADGPYSNRIAAHSASAACSFGPFLRDSRYKGTVRRRVAVAGHAKEFWARLCGEVEHAATGLAAAWQITHFAAFRIATFFLAEYPSKELREKLGFREDARGASLWLMLPNDAGVFHKAETRDGLRCVHPVQAYVDLKAHPERATEAAERLRSELHPETASLSA